MNYFAKMDIVKAATPNIGGINNIKPIKHSIRLPYTSAFFIFIQRLVIYYDNIHIDFRAPLVAPPNFV